MFIGNILKTSKLNLKGRKEDMFAGGGM